MKSPDSSAVTRDIAVVGAGYWGKNLARNFNALGALHTICDSNGEALAEYGSDYSLASKEPDFERVLRNSEIRRVALATPAVRHYQMARACLEAGKDLFVEKPLCVRVSEAEDLVQLAQKHGLLLMVGHLLHYHPCIERLRSIL